MFKVFSLLAAGVALVLAAPVMADDWTAVKLRGEVFAVSPQSSTQWIKLKRGDIVSDARAVRTFGSGNVEFQRGNETVAYGPNTQAAIVDRQGQRPYTTVVETMGTVAVEADVRQVQHFAVQTPYLVAVVKGTLFSVSTTRRDSTVVVKRGLVAVTGGDSHKSVLVAAGQTASVAAAGGVEVSGAANAALTHPVVNGVAEDAPDAGVGGAVGAVGDTLGDAVGSVGGALGNTVGTLGGDVGDTVGSLTGSSTLGNTVGGVTNTVGNTVSSVTNTVGNTVGGVTGGVGNVLGHLGL